MRIIKAFLFLLIISHASISMAAKPEVIIEGPVIEGVNSTILIKADLSGEQEVFINGKPQVAIFNNGVAEVSHAFESGKIEVRVLENTISKSVGMIPGWMSLLPPLLAIILALLFREVMSALFVGILTGALIISCYADGLAGIIPGFLSVIDNYILNSLNDADHLSVIVFSTLIGGMVVLISRNGGMAGIVDKLSRYAKDARSGQLTTWFLGLVIFFDDYANTLVVGNTMRPATDKLRISREKLSYIVDSTAAPVASVAFITTWIGAELGYIKDGISSLPDLNESPYVVFVNSLAYSFYPVFTLVFILFLIFKRKDFGPMLKAERRARTTGRVSEARAAHEEEKINEEIGSLTPTEDVPHRWWNAAIPVLVVIVGTILGLYFTGRENTSQEELALPFFKKVSAIIGNADSYRALLWSSMAGLMTAFLLTVFQKIMNVGESVETMLKGFKTMLTAILILILAWSLALTTVDLHTADFITGFLIGMDLNPVFLPMATFILSAVVSFSTGSSWGTMAILYPLMLPAGWMLSREAGMSYEDSLSIFHNLASCVLAGSVLGDHCSPISDTTILSSLASSCNHIDHVRTQLPYALTVGLVAMVVGTLLSGFGISSWILMPAGLIILYLIVHFFGKSSETDGSAID